MITPYSNIISVTTLEALLLDTYSGAAAAYSLRKLSATYTGSAIRVRRASDNTEQDIGFVSNELDTSALTTFCSGTDGFVETWYDQSDFSGTQNASTLGSYTGNPFISITTDRLGARSGTYSDGNLQEIVLYSSNQSSNRTGIRTNINAQYQIYWDGSQTSLLDSYGGSAAAYSLRALSSAYVGPLVRVRRASDNAEQDIYANYDGTLNTSSLESFCSGTDGFVETWYDQSGNGKDATQLTAANQPQIVSSGSVILDNGKPAILWNKAGNNNLRNLSVSTSASMTFSWVGSMTLPTSSFSYAFEIGTFGASTGYLFTPRIHNGIFDYATGDLVNFGKGYTTSSAPRFISNGVQVVNNTQVLFNGILTSTIAKAYKNNSAITSRVAIAASVPITSSLKIGTNTFNEAYPGKMQELIFWGLDQDANINGINTNINDFYSIY
jgi:hypothetical protein